jgi:5'-nucleotidase
LLLALGRWTAALGGLWAGAAASQTGRTTTRAVTLTVVHLNDVYEILPVEGGKSGGLARVAAVIHRLKKSGAPVLTTLGGDYLSPSALGTAIVDGQPLAGRQMVDVLNATGLDFATFGNHEFDVAEAAFRAHLAQAKFKLISSNVTDANAQPFPGVATSTIVPVRAAGGRTLRIGLVAVTIDSNPRTWVRYREAIQAARGEVENLHGRTDAIVALTHLSLQQDAEFVSAIPGLDLVLGGHEHENWLMYRGAKFVPVVKADANVRSLAVITLTFGKPGSRPDISARLQPIDDTIPSAPAVEAVARQWVERGFAAFRRQGFSPEAVVAVTTEPLDGRESTVRNRPGKLTDLIVDALAREAGTPDVAVFNAGSVRIDDVVPAGPITEYDILRILPFGGRIAKASFDGALVKRVLDTGGYNEGLGGYLHVAGAKLDGGVWTIRGAPLDPAARYSVALPDFLLTGNEINMGFLTRANPAVRDVVELRDIRRVVIEELARVYPPKPAPR